MCVAHARTCHGWIANSRASTIAACRMRSGPAPVQTFRKICCWSSVSGGSVTCSLGSVEVIMAVPPRLLAHGSASMRSTTPRTRPPPLCRCQAPGTRTNRLSCARLPDRDLCALYLSWYPEGSPQGDLTKRFVVDAERVGDAIQDDLGEVVRVSVVPQPH